MGTGQSKPKPQPQEQESAEEEEEKKEAALHQSDADEDDENVKQLNECSSFYLSLQECLVNKNRNWKACQPEVQALKACNERRKISQGK